MRRFIGSIAVVGVAALLFTPVVATAHAQEPDQHSSEASAADAEESNPSTEASTLTGLLADAVEAGAESPEQVAEELSLPAEGGGSLNFDTDGRVSVTVRFAAGPSDADLAALAAAGAEVTAHYPMFNAVSARVDPLAIDEVEQLPSVLGVDLNLRASTSAEIAGHRSSSTAGSAPAIRPALDLSADGCRAVPVEADEPLRADLARAVFGADGTGVTIGIISDSFRKNTLITSPEDDVLAGALPGPGNPCGYETPVEILPPEVDEGDDEGRAMAQLVHGIAPGAKLVFANAGESEIAMATSIYNLAAAGADIIVDDISFHSELYFQRGLISAMINRVKQEFGVTYFTSAGNSNAATEIGGELLPLVSWQTDAYRAMECPTWLVQDAEDSLIGAAGYDCLDFDPSEGELAYDTLWIGEGDEPFDLRPFASIGEPFLGVTTSYQLRFYQADSSNPAADPELISAISAFGGSLPGLSGRIEADPETELRMVMVRTAFDAAVPAPPVWLSFIRGGDAIQARHFMGDGAGDIVGPTVFGHGGDGSGLSVAALHWDEPEKVRDYSSLGPGTMWFEDYQLPDTAPRPRLAEPEAVEAPHLAAVDGTATTFFGELDDDGAYRFFGTSAAAPHAAAVAALGLSSRPGLAEGQLEQFVLATARGSDCCGPVNPYGSSISDEAVFGAGIVDAMGLLVALAPTQMSEQGVSSDRAAVAWQAAGQAEEFTLLLFEGDLSDEDLSGLDVLSKGVGQLGVTGPAGAVSPAAVAAAPAVVSSLAGGLGLPRFTAPLAAQQTHSLPGNVSSYTFSGLAPASSYTAILVTHYGQGYGSIARLSVTTAAAPDPTPAPPSPAPTPVPPAPAPDKSLGPIPGLGGADNAWWFIGGGAVLVLAAAGLLVAGLMRNRRRAAAHTDDAPTADGA